MPRKTSANGYFRRYFVGGFVFFGLIQLLLSLSAIRSWDSPEKFDFHGYVDYGFPFVFVRHGYAVSEFYFLGLVLNLALLLGISLMTAWIVRKI